MPPPSFFTFLPQPSIAPPFWVTREEAWECGGAILEGCGCDFSVMKDEVWRGRWPAGCGFAAPKNVVRKKMRLQPNPPTGAVPLGTVG